VNIRRFFSFSLTPGHAVLVTISVGMAVLFALRAYHIGEPADASAYRSYALGLRVRGRPPDIGSIRSYGYILFLYFISLPFGGIALAVKAATIQYVAFLSASLWLSRSVAKVDPTWATPILVATICNPVLIALVVDTLTESLTLPIAVFLLGITAQASNCKDKRRLLMLFCLGTMFAAYCVMIRPANVVILFAWSAAAIFALLRVPISAKDKFWYAASFALSWLAITLALSAPQLYYNYTTWHQWSVFPVCRIGSMQALFGLGLLKYDTVMVNGIAQSWYYANPFFLGDPPERSAWTWYLAHPLRGLATFIGHIVSAFSVTDVFTYRSSIPPSYVTAAFYWILFVFGSYRIFCVHRRAIGRMLSKSATLSLLVLFAGLLFVGTVTLIGLSAPEVRFAAIPIAILSAAGVRQLTMAADRSSLSPTALVLCLLVAAGLLAISSFLEQLGSADLPFQWLAVDLAKLQCFHFAVPGSGK
jgi:hypothetical protein